MLTKTPAMHRIFEIIRLVAPTEATVVIEGETGTEKEAVASAIHDQSPRQRGPFVMITCAGMPETQVEDDLFGCETDSAIGDHRPRIGTLERAAGGTLFLDNIDCLSLMTQAKLLRVLEEQKIQRLGESQSVDIDVRTIVGTNISFKNLVAEGRMRSDFYYRMNVISISLIPLRQRKADIPLLVQDFLHNYALAVEKGIARVSVHALDQLVQYGWPGDVRELHDVLEKAVRLGTSPILEEVDLPDTLSSKEHEENPPVLPLSEWIKEQEKRYLIQRLKSFGGNIELTAKSCRVDTRTLYRKMRQYGIDRKTFRPKASEGFVAFGNTSAGVDRSLVKK